MVEEINYICIFVCINYATEGGSYVVYNNVRQFMLSYPKAD